MLIKLIRNNSKLIQNRSNRQIVFNLFSIKIIKNSLLNNKSTYKYLQPVNRKYFIYYGYSFPQDSDEEGDEEGGEFDEYDDDGLLINKSELDDDISSSDSSSEFESDFISSDNDSEYYDDDDDDDAEVELDLGFPEEEDMELLEMDTVVGADPEPDSKLYRLKPKDYRIELKNKKISDRANGKVQAILDFIKIKQIYSSSKSHRKMKKALKHSDNI